MKKLLSIIMTALMLTVSFSGMACANRTGEQVKDGYTPLYVNVLSCGVGTDFIDSLETKFEALCENEGLKVDVISTNNGVNGPEGLTAVRTGNPTDIFYFNMFDISVYTNIAAQSSDALADITDIVTEGGEGSIYNRLFDEQRDYFNLGTDDAPKFYALPWFSSFYGTVYDVELFRECHFYRNDPNLEATSFLNQYSGLDGIVGNADDAYGPDGVDGTVDDGLPATWNDMTLLLLDMKRQNVKPFAFTMQANYTEAWLYSVWASYEGASNIDLMRTFNGTYVKRNDAGEIENVVIDPSNAYLLSEQNGKKAALEVANYLVRGNYCCSNSFDAASEDNLEAQKTYLRSFLGKDANKDDQRIAFLMEGTWWENEAKDYFGALAAERNDPSLAYGTREFGFMPFPKFIGTAGIPDQTHDKTVLRGGWISSSAGAVMISKNTDQLELAKKFLKFAYSEEMNADFTYNSGVTVPMDYEMSSEQLAKITPFQRNIFELMQSPYVEVVSGASRSQYILREPDVIKNIASFSMLETDVATAVKAAPMDMFRQNQGLTVAKYWEGVKRANPQKNWANMPWMKG